MKRITSFLAFLFAITMLLATTMQVKAQEEEKSSPISIGADLMSRYVWRGTDYGSSPSIQPSMELGLGGFALGLWGAYTTNLPGVQELDLYATYTFSNVVTIGITDYFFPDEIFGYDSQNSTYFELVYSFSILDIFLGAGKGFYTTDGKFNIVNLGISVSKNIKITEKFSLPVSASFITNPQAEKVHFVFGISL